MIGAKNLKSARISCFGGTNKDKRGSWVPAVDSAGKGFFLTKVFRVVKGGRMAEDVNKGRY